VKPGIARIGAAVIAGAMVLTGCGSATEKITETVIESAGGGEVDIDFDESEGTFSVESEEGSLSVGGDGPKNWPEDIPLPQGMDFAMEQTESEEFVITGWTYGEDANLGDIISDYVDALGDAGFTNGEYEVIDSTGRGLYRRGEEAVSFQASEGYFAVSYLAQG
jgi:hypothetical protein